MSKANIETVTAYESGYEHGEGVGYKHGYKQGKAEGEQVALGTSRMLEAAREELNCQDTEIGQLKTDRDEWKRRALEAEEAGRAILEWEGANCDGYADKVSDDCPFCKMRAVLNSINSGKEKE